VSADPLTTSPAASAGEQPAVARIRHAYLERKATGGAQLVAAQLARELAVSETTAKLTLRALRGRHELTVDPTTVQDRIERLYQTRERQAGEHLRVREVAAEVGTNPRYAAATLYVLRALDRDGPTPRTQWAAARTRTAGPADLDQLASLRRAAEHGRDGGWRADAACASPGVDPELFFPERGEHWKAAEAKQVCAGCSVQAACLHEALTGPQAHGEDVTGIFGGTSQQERRRLRGRPRLDTPTRFSTDQGQAAEALELARRVGMTRAAAQLGVSTEALYHAWDRWQLGRPHGHRGSPPSQVHTDRNSAVGAFQRAQQIGITATAAETGVSHRTLRKAWVHHGLGLPERPPRAPATRSLDRGFLELPGNEAFARSTRAGPGQLAARARRLEELETLTPRVVYDATAENRWPRRETRVWVIAARAKRAADLATQHTLVEQGDPREQVRQRLAASHQRRQAARAQRPTQRGSRSNRTRTSAEPERER
jgi:WhiB family redox-sensing transcriptional regulator